MNEDLWLERLEQTLTDDILETSDENILLTKCHECGKPKEAQPLCDRWDCPNLKPS